MAMTEFENLGQVVLDAHESGAEIAAAGRDPVDVHDDDAGGGSYFRNLGQSRGDTQGRSAEIAAAGQTCSDAQGIIAGGGT